MRKIGVAWSAGIIGAFSHIVLPMDASKHKVEAVMEMKGVNVTICGNGMAARQETAEKLILQHPNWEFIHPGDWKIGAGQGTIAFEIIEQVENMLTNCTSLAAGEELIFPWWFKCMSAVYIC